jgi:hypothetical protein
MQALADLARHARRFGQRQRRAERCGEGDRRAATPEPSWTPGGYAAGGTGAGHSGLGSTAPGRISPPTWFARANSGSRLPPGVERPSCRGPSTVIRARHRDRRCQSQSGSARTAKASRDGPRETCSACLMAWPPQMSQKHARRCATSSLPSRRECSTGRQDDDRGGAAYRQPRAASPGTPACRGA